MDVSQGKQHTQRKKKHNVLPEVAIAQGSSERNISAVVSREESGTCDET